MAFDDTAVGEFDVVNREAAQVGNFFNRTLGPVVRAQVFRFFFMQINVFRADADPDFMLVRNAQAVVDADVVFQAVTFDDREIGAVVNNDAVKNIGFADKFSGKATVRVIVHVARRTDLAQLAVGHNGDTGSHRHRFFLVVGNHDAGYADLFQRVDQFQLGLLAQFFIECAQRFVKQQDFRTFRQAACQSDTLLLAAGKLVRLAFGVFGHLHQAQHFFDAGVDFAFRHFVLFQTESDVLFNTHVWEQGIALEHHVDWALVRGKFGNVLAVENDFALIWAFHACQHAQQRRFATA